LRTIGATSVPSSSIARSNFACGNAATLIWNVIREMPPNDSFTRQDFFRDGFRIAHQKRAGRSELGVEVRASHGWPSAFPANLSEALRIAGKKLVLRPRRTVGDVT